MMRSLQKVKAFLQAETRGAAHVLKFAMQEFWWAAVLAAGMQLLGGGTGGVKGFAETMFFLRALKFPLELLQILKYDFQHYMQGCFEKLRYMERRQMCQGYGSGDICRIMRQDIEAYEATCGNRRWLQRRMRDHFEAWMKANEGLGDHMKERLRKIWSLVCTEVLLRACRDIAAERSACPEDGEQLKQDGEHKKRTRILKNLQIEWCEFWSPVKVEDWSDVEDMICQHYVEICLQSQLKERMEEFQEYAAKAGDAGNVDYVFMGMPELVKSFVRSSCSSEKKEH